MQKGKASKPCSANPKAAVIAGPAIFVVQDGKAVRRVVTLGAERSGRVEIFSGLAVGERVIVGGLAGLADGMTVTSKQ